MIHLSTKWRIKWDDQQWIVQVLYGKDWRGEWFVGSNKTALMRVLREAGATLDAEGLSNLSGLPDTFKEFILAQGRTPEWTE